MAGDSKHETSRKPRTEADHREGHARPASAGTKREAGAEKNRGKEVDEKRKTGRGGSEGGGGGGSVERENQKALDRVVRKVRQSDMAHIRQSRSDFDLGFEGKGLEKNSHFPG